MKQDRSSWPPLVRLGLWGLPNRGTAWFFFWFSIVAALACIGLGFVHPYFFAGGGLFLAALWYFLSIRWVDENSSW